VKHYFLSDAHLYPGHLDHPGREPLKRFLTELSMGEPGKLWILGDLFDYWFEYRTVIPAGFSEMLSLLRKLSDSGWEMAFLPGNHDWWCGDHLASETGMQIIRESISRQVIEGRQTIISHGDGLGKGDTGYRMIKPVMRSRSAIFLFSLLHPTAAAGLAGVFSNTSRRILRKQVDTVPAYLTQWVKEQADNGTELVVTGHTHCPLLIRHEGLLHASIGDWISHFTYLRVEGEEVKLHEFRR